MKHLIKVQIPKHITENALKNPRTSLKSDFEKTALTFHAYSDTMKARVLEMICGGAET